MWIVKNELRATVTLRGLGVSIEAGEEFDLDAIGRETAEKSPQVLVALEEGYISNVYKEPSAPQAPPTAAAPAAEVPKNLLTTGEFQERLEQFKQQFLTELKSRLPALEKLDKLDLLESAPTGAIDLRLELDNVRKAIASDMRTVVGEVEAARGRIEEEKRRVLADASLSESEIRARVAFLEEKERELAKNFETVGRTVEATDGDVMDKADLLSNL